MKIGVGYLIFSGAELLKPAIMQIRPHVDYVVGLYSTKSNCGDDAPAFLKPLVESLREQGLLDEIIEFNPSKEKCIYKLQDCERDRYEIGREICQVKGCTHYMTCDCDEFYDSKQFSQTVNMNLTKDFYAVRLRDYVKSPFYRAKQLSRLHVPFIHKIECPYEKKNYSVLMDTGRTVRANSFEVLSPKQIIMHHFTAVRFCRLEMIRKFQGHSHFTRLGGKEKEVYMNKIYNADSDQEYEKIEDIFGVQKYWNEEFRSFYNMCMK